MGRISPGPTRWPPGAERRLVPAKSNLKPQTSDDEPPSMTSASPSEDDDPEDPENPSGKKKKKKKNTRRPGGGRSQEAKAIATSKIVVNLPEFTGKDHQRVG